MFPDYQAVVGEAAGAGKVRIRGNVQDHRMPVGIIILARGQGDAVASNDPGVNPP